MAELTDSPALIDCRRQFVAAIIQSALVDLVIYPMRFAAFQDAYEFLYGEHGAEMMYLIELDPPTVRIQAASRRREAQHLYETGDADG